MFEREKKKCSSLGRLRYVVVGLYGSFESEGEVAYPLMTMG